MTSRSASSAHKTPDTYVSSSSSSPIVSLNVIDDAFYVEAMPRRKPPANPEAR